MNLCARVSHSTYSHGILQGALACLQENEIDDLVSNRGMATRMSPDNRSPERRELFRTLRERARQSVSIVNLTSPESAARGHQSWAWDASVMPAGGHYYPVFVELIDKFEREGSIRPDTHTLVETTTGTAGIALGHVAKCLGYDVILFMPEDMPRRRIEAVQNNLPTEKSELRFTPGREYAKGMLRTFQKFLIDERTSYAPNRQGKHGGKELFALNHSRRPEAISALEPLIRQATGMLPIATRFTHTVAALGNGTSSTALFNVAKDRFPEIRRIGVEPIEAPTVYIRKFGEQEFVRRFSVPARFKSHELFGTGGWGVGCPHLNVSQIDDVLPVSAEAWRAEKAALARRGFNLGNSSAACQMAVEAFSAQSENQGANFFSIVYDRAEMY